jgi:hypothetical protein
MIARRQLLRRHRFSIISACNTDFRRTPERPVQPHAEPLDVPSGGRGYAGCLISINSECERSAKTADRDCVDQSMQS